MGRKKTGAKQARRCENCNKIIYFLDQTNTQVSFEWCSYPMNILVRVKELSGTNLILLQTICRHIVLYGDIVVIVFVVCTVV